MWIWKVAIAKIQWPGGRRDAAGHPLKLGSVVCLALVCGWVAQGAEPTRVFQVTDFGTSAERAVDAGPALRAAIAAARASGPGAEVVLPAGEYRIRRAEKTGACVNIENAEGLTIRGVGAETRVIVTDPTAGAFVFRQCRRAVLRDLVIDYDPVPFCQGWVRGIDAAAGSFDVEIETGFPEPGSENFLKAAEPYGKWGMIMDPEARRIRTGTPDHFMTPRWESLGERRWRFFTADDHYRSQLRYMRVGDGYLHLARGHGSAVVAHDCDGVRIERITLHASPGLAVGLIANRGEMVVRQLEVRFAPNRRGWLTTNADGVHCQQNRTGPIIEDCYFEGMADDAINIYAPPNVLREVRSPTRWRISEAVPAQVGDRFQVLDPKTGRVRGILRAAAVRRVAGLQEVDWEEGLEGAVAGAHHRAGDTLYNLNACGAGFQIRRNRMVGHRRYGCLIRAGAGVIEGNVFEDTTGAGVMVTNEPDWPEGPVPWSVTIRSNQFIRGGTCLGYADAPHGAALGVRAMRLGHASASGEEIAGMLIEANEFIDRGGAILYLGGIRGATVRGNRAVARSDAELRRKGPAILVERSSGTVLTGNAIVDPREGTTAAVQIGEGVPPGPEGVRIEATTSRLGARAVPILDRRNP
ncbi:MAG: right-handed parallel beta-helix repeat-containing protein [Verrucomicrobiales bacterium]|nr:right-handed parallel beta-helix repeat-containing protein [Verrucomicrobiales bacterium]